MQCTHCGHQNRQDARFCAACGTALSAAVAGPRPDGATTAAAASLRSRALVPGLFALALLLAAMLGFWLLSSTPDPLTPGPLAAPPADNAPAAEVPGAAQPPASDAAAVEPAPAEAPPTSPAPQPAPSATPPTPANEAQAPRPPEASVASPDERTAAPDAADPGDWLTTLRQELARCEQLNFFTRIPCREKARWRHCAERWNSVPECATGEHNP